MYQSVKESSAIEGIRHPFAKGKRTFWPETMEEFVKYWKKRVAALEAGRRVRSIASAKSVSSGA